MTPKKRYLTKSRFKQAWECPTKLYYTGKTKIYGDTRVEDAFLKALAKGGFQVGALAQCYYPDGIEVETLDSEIAIKETEQLLKRESVTLFEAGISYGNLLARVDVLKKEKNHFELIEVKAKSYDSGEDSFLSKRPSKTNRTGLLAAWEPYLVDVAFQTYVLRQARPEAEVVPYLCLADKSKVATVERLHQKFFLTKDASGRTKVVIRGATDKEALGREILAKVDVTEEVERILSAKYNDRSFGEMVAALADAYVRDEKISTTPSGKCKNCEYRIDEEMKGRGLKSGFEECWKTGLKLKESDFGRPFVFDLWNFRKSDDLIDDGRVFLDQVTREDIFGKSKTKGKEKDEAGEDAEGGLNQKERQWLQVVKTQKIDPTSYIDKQGLAEAFKKFSYPLHMIDFETTMSAIPFYKGARPYEQIAFQFSHHLVHEDGRIEHKTEYIERVSGRFPNFDFVRALKKALGDRGSIFRYATHENTILIKIREQLEAAVPTESDPLSDRKDLIAWIETLTTKKEGKELLWQGNRNMVDLKELETKYYFNPQTGGSNSLKYVLPAILNESRFVQDKYGKPIYGTAQIPSLNYQNFCWIKFDKNGKVFDPYSLLPPIFSTEIDAGLERMSEGDEIREGGAAMMAYAQMQFSEMTDKERSALISGLLKYCELDTFAMVLLYEHWKSVI